MNITQHTLLPILIAAGEAGMTTTEMATRAEFADAYSKAAGASPKFRDPSHQYRSNRVSAIMRDLAKRGVTEQIGYGISPLYHDIPVKRWRAIQPAADEYLKLPSREQRAEARRLRELEWRRERDAAARRRAAILEQAREQYGPGVSSCTRTRVCRELRAERISLDDIGAVFGITRERARQVIAGKQVKPCRCSDCLKERWRGSVIEPEVYSPWADGRIDGPGRVDQSRHAS